MFETAYEQTNEVRQPVKPVFGVKILPPTQDKRGENKKTFKINGVFGGGRKVGFPRGRKVGFPTPLKFLEIIFTKCDILIPDLGKQLPRGRQKWKVKKLA